MLLFVCALTIFASCEQTKNRQVENEQIEIANDSIQTYINQARNLDADAYVKLADCYHRGIGVEHNFAMMMHMLWLADLYSREEGLA